jgi:site-specific DNA-methyltransferase (adenine-specific)
MLKPYYEQDGIIIYHGDCREILPLLDVKVDLVLTDPPYGIGANKMTLGTGNHTFERGDDWDNQRQPEIISQLLHYPKVAIWGGNYYTDILPMNNKWLIWHKLNDGLSFSEAELAWTNFSMNTRVFSKYCANRIKQHPTEKPQELMSWCIGLAGADLILDPFLGSGTTAVASKILGRRCIGIEISQAYCDIAIKRLSQSVMRLEA